VRTATPPRLAGVRKKRTSYKTVGPPLRSKGIFAPWPPAGRTAGIASWINMPGCNATGLSPPAAKRKCRRLFPRHDQSILEWTLVCPACNLHRVTAAATIGKQPRRLRRGRRMANPCGYSSIQTALPPPRGGLRSLSAGAGCLATKSRALSELLSCARQTPTAPAEVGWCFPRARPRRRNWPRANAPVPRDLPPQTCRRNGGSPAGDRRSRAGAGYSG